MHELSIALNIVDAAAEELYRRGGTRVGAIHLRLGLLSGVVPAALRSAFEMARAEEPITALAELVIEEIPVAVYCPVCSVERLIVFPELCCPTCRTPTPDVIRGRELEVVALEIET